MPASLALLLLALLALLLLALLHGHLLAAKGLSTLSLAHPAASRTSRLAIFLSGNRISEFIHPIRITSHLFSHLVLTLAFFMNFSVNHYTLPRYFFFLILDK
jgi:hypothetical protein